MSASDFDGFGREPHVQPAFELVGPLSTAATGRLAPCSFVPTGSLCRGRAPFSRKPTRAAIRNSIWHTEQRASLVRTSRRDGAVHESPSRARWVQAGSGALARPASVQRGTDEVSGFSGHAGSIRFGENSAALPTLSSRYINLSEWRFTTPLTCNAVYRRLRESNDLLYVFPNL